MAIVSQDLDELLVERLVRRGIGEAAVRDVVEQRKVDGRIVGSCCLAGGRIELSAMNIGCACETPGKLTAARLDREARGRQPSRRR